MHIPGKILKHVFQKISPLYESSRQVPLTGYCYGVVSNEVLHVLQPFSDLFCALSEFLSFLIHPPKFSGKYQQRQLVANQRSLARNGGEFCWQNIVFIFRRVILTLCKTLWRGADCFTYPPNEVVLWIFIALKNLLSSAGFECANLECNGKHDNH
jgi:hypothetical protein